MISNIINSRMFTFDENNFIIEASLLSHLITNEHSKTISIQSNKTGEIVEFKYSHQNKNRDMEIVAEIFKPLQKYIDKNDKLKFVELVVINT